MAKIVDGPVRTSPAGRCSRSQTGGTWRAGQGRADRGQLRSSRSSGRSARGQSGQRSDSAAGGAEGQRHRWRHDSTRRRQRYGGAFSNAHGCAGRARGCAGMETPRPIGTSGLGGPMGTGAAVKSSRKSKSVEKDMKVPWQKGTQTHRR